MIAVTGALGFIGSCYISFLNSQGIYDIIAIDDFSKIEKNQNLNDKKIALKIDRRYLFDDLYWVNNCNTIVHLGARTDTAEQDSELFNTLNVEFSKSLWHICVKHQIKFIYASSAATYGDGSLGFDDDESNIKNLKPMNPYGMSKHIFDMWVLEQNHKPKVWAGLKFFNVYGPNEYHKSRMASMIFHGYNQIKQHHFIKLFKSHLPNYEHGMQVRDFIYVKDICNVIYYLSLKQELKGIYNLGSGQAETWNHLATYIFNALNLKIDIRYIDIPLDIRSSYQYFTLAKIEKLKQIGYSIPFTSLQDGVNDYISNYLSKDMYY